MLDYTLKMFDALCKTLAENDYFSVCMKDYFKETAPEGKFRVFLRHDVDRLVSSALDCAAIENKYGLKATYFFRCVDKYFVPEVIEKIFNMGMEVGYHYECLDRARGNYEKAIEIFQEDLIKLREIAPVTSMAMHGNPLTPYDNRDLWKKYDFREYGIEVSAYLTLDYSRIRYFSDTGRNWSETRGNLFDFVDHRQQVSLSSTPTLIDFLKSSKQDTCLLIHPNRWTNDPLKWSLNAIYDLLGNTAKKIIKIKRKVGSRTAGTGQAGPSKKD